MEVVGADESDGFVAWFMVKDNCGNACSYICCFQLIILLLT